MVRTKVLWHQQLDSGAPIHAIAWNPQGTRFAISKDNEILMFRATDKAPMKQLKAHEAPVYALAWSSTGQYLISGSADGVVIIWTAECEGKSSFQLSDAIQSIDCCPISNIFTVVSTSQFAEVKSITQPAEKSSLGNDACCIKWAPDGTQYAIGFFDGSVAVRNTAGSSLYKLRIQSQQPVWCLQWVKKVVDDQERLILVVGCWDQSLSFFSDTQLLQTVNIGFDPCFMDFVSDQNLILCGGSSGKAKFYTLSGVEVATVAEAQSWIWQGAIRPDTTQLTLGTYSGTIASEIIIFPMIHSLYNDTYVFLEKLNNVVIQNTITDARSRIVCPSTVKKIAVYDNRLAIMLEDKILVYRLNVNDHGGWNIKHYSSVPMTNDSALMLVTAQAMLFCSDVLIEAYDFSANMLKKWEFPAAIRYAKVFTSIAGNEVLLIGLKNGDIYRMYLGADFYTHLLTVNGSVRCIDFNANRTKIACVDGLSTLTIYNLKTKTVEYTHKGITTCSFNRYHDDLISFAGQKTMFLKCDKFPIIETSHNGYCVGFQNNKVFLLNFNNVSILDVSFSIDIRRYVSLNEFKKAWKLSTLGSTDQDIEYIGMFALRNLNFEVAKQCYQRLKKVFEYEYIVGLEKSLKAGVDRNELQGRIYAFLGQFKQASQFFQKSNPSLSVEMYSDLCKWEECPLVTNELIERQATYEYDLGNVQRSAQLYMSIKNFDKAVKLTLEDGEIEGILKIARLVPRQEVDLLRKLSNVLVKCNQIDAARDILVKIGDQASVINLLIHEKDWDTLFIQIKTYPEYSTKVHTAYGSYLIENNEFESAIEHLNMAGNLESSIAIMRRLLFCNIMIHNLRRISLFCQKLNLDTLVLMGKTTNNNMLRALSKYSIETNRHALLYHCYDLIERHIKVPFSSMSDRALFNASVLLMGFISDLDVLPYMMDVSFVLFVLAQSAYKLGCNKTAREALQSLLQHKVKEQIHQQATNLFIQLRGKPFSDNQEFESSCSQCGSALNIIEPSDTCRVCNTQRVRCMASFEIIPICEFFIPPEMDVERAIHYANLESGEEVTLPMAESIMLSEDDLTLLSPDSVFVHQNVDAGLTCFYYLREDIPIYMCSSCGKFLLDEYYEEACLNGSCPMCNVALE
ncbi:hypothetical protein PCE1_001396 [Barthelona sp. PCE]